MTYEVQKAVWIPLFPGDRWHKDSDVTTELWQPVGQAHLDEQEARNELKKFREYNKGKGLHYRLVKIIEEKSSEE